MPIKGLTDQYRAGGPTAALGRQVRIGYLQKGRRGKDPSGKMVLEELDHWRFKPHGIREDLALKAFREAYGDKPRTIPDVRLPADLAGNYRIEDQAWLVVSRHSRAGRSLFLARSDGEEIYQARDSETGRMMVYREGERPPHGAMSQVDDKGRDSFKYQGRLYPWTGSMMIDLVLPDLNRALMDHGVRDYGLVTFITHSKNDIPNLIRQYQGILHEIASLFGIPGSAEYERAGRFVPLRDIPLVLSRYQADITTPGYGNDKPGDRRPGKRWLCRLSINSNFAQAMEAARRDRTAALMGFIAQGGQLLESGQATAALGSGGRPEEDLESLNDLLFDPPRITPTRPPDPPEDMEEVIEGYLEEEELEEDDPDEVLGDQDPELEAAGIQGTLREGVIGGDPDPEEDPFTEEADPEPDEDGALPMEISEIESNALRTRTLKRFTAYAAKAYPVAYADPDEAARGYRFMCGNWDPANKDLSWAALKVYANMIADGEPKKNAANVAKSWYTEAVKARSAGGKK